MRTWLIRTQWWYKAWKHTGWLLLHAQWSASYKPLKNFNFHHVQPIFNFDFHPSSVFIIQCPYNWNICPASKVSNHPVAHGTLWTDSTWSHRWWGQNSSKPMWSPSPPASVPAKDKVIVEGNVGWDWSWSSKHVYFRGPEISIYNRMIVCIFTRRTSVRYFTWLTNFFAGSCHFRSFSRATVVVRLQFLTY